MEKKIQSDINLGYFINIFKRRKRFIFFSFFSSLSLSLVYVYTTKPVYQGDFEIVLSSQNKAGAAALIAQNPSLAALAELGSGGEDSLETEVFILKSPSVLKPVYSLYNQLTGRITNTQDFKKWVSSHVNININKGTRILSVSFQSEEKNVILPIVNLISQEYQKYSNRARQRELDNIIVYLENQTNQYKLLHAEASKLALDHAYKYNLSIKDGLPLSSTSSSATVENLESSRASVLKEIHTLKVQIKSAKEAGKSSIFFASQLGAVNNKNSTFDQLTKVESRLAELESRFKSDDPLVLRLKREREVLIGYINFQTIGLLEGELAVNDAKLKSLERPKGIVDKHRELMQSSLRIEATLVEMQKQLQSYKLEKARYNAPWELISTPILLDQPIRPQKKKSILSFMFYGLLFGLVGAVARDKFSERYYALADLKANVPYPFLASYSATINLTEDNIDDVEEKLVSARFEAYASISIIPIGEFENYSIDELVAKLNNFAAKVVFYRDLDSIELNNTDGCILVFDSSDLRKAKISSIIESISLWGKPCFGWILIE